MYFFSMSLNNKYFLHAKPPWLSLLFIIEKWDDYMKKNAPPLRPDRSGSHRAQYEFNKKRILQTQDICSICGKPVDKTLKYPDPMSPVIDHIIPVNKGGHPQCY